MNTANKIQIGLLGLIVLMLGFMMFNGGGSSDTSARDAARASLGSGNTPAITNNATAKKPEPAKPVGPTTKMEFSEKKFDFGNITEGEKVTHVFKFKNTGKEPLVISKAKGSCGCTVPQWPKEPIAPGKSGEIKVEFNSKGKSGKNNKTVTITANTDPVNTTLNISADVAKDPNAKPAKPAPAPLAPAK